MTSQYAAAVALAAVRFVGVASQYAAAVAVAAVRLVGVDSILLFFTNQARKRVIFATPCEKPDHRSLPTASARRGLEL